MAPQPTQMHFIISIYPQLILLIILIFHLYKYKIGAVSYTDYQGSFELKIPSFHANAEAWGLAKIIRPAEVCKALVTTTRSSPPT